MSRSSHVRLSARLSVSTQTRFPVLKLSGRNLSKRLTCIAVVSRNEPDRTTVSYGSHRNNTKYIFFKCNKNVNFTAFEILTSTLGNIILLIFGNFEKN